MDQWPFYATGGWAWASEQSLVLSEGSCEAIIDQVSCILPNSPFSMHPHVSMCDGSVRSISPDADRKTLWALVTLAGHEVIGEDW